MRASTDTGLPAVTSHRAAKIDVSRVKEYKTLAELRSDSTTIAVVTAISARSDSVNGIPATVTSVSVDRSGWGAPPTSNIDILQLGGPNADSPGTSQLLTIGSQYLVFVTPYHLGTTDHTGLYVITGDQGVFKLTGATFNFSGGGNPGFDRQVPLADWVAVVTR